MPTGYWHLQTLWFGLIAVLWIGYFVLEGFDFGVGTLLPFLGRDDTERRVLINTIGPVWDGNEVWLLVAGGATFAAFPGWYATLFSGFYLALFLILVALIIRGVAFEYRGKHDSPRWRAWWDRAIFARLGAARAAVGRRVRQHRPGRADRRRRRVHGQPLHAAQPVRARRPGSTSLALFTLHGAVFLTLKTKGEMVERARAAAQRLSARRPPCSCSRSWPGLRQRRLGPRQGDRARCHPALAPWASPSRRPSSCGPPATASRSSRRRSRSA